MNAPLELLDDAYDELVDDFHDSLAARVGAALERLREVEDELAEIQVELESGP